MARQQYLASIGLAIIIGACSGTGLIGTVSQGVGGASGAIGSQGTGGCGATFKGGTGGTGFLSMASQVLTQCCISGDSSKGMCGGYWVLPSNLSGADSSGADWSLKQAACLADGWDLSPYVGKRVDFECVGIPNPTSGGPTMSWVLYTGSTVVCTYQTNNSQDIVPTHCHTSG